MSITASMPATQRPLRARRAPSSVRLTRRGRIVVGALVSLPFAALLVITGSVAADAETADPRGSATATVVVQPGENLWSIAQAVAPHDDPRSTITIIRDLNSLGTDTVVPGQSIVVPRFSS